MALDRGDYDQAVAALRPAFERYDESGDERGAASASVGLGFIATPRAAGEGESRIHEAVDTFRKLDYRSGLAFALLALGSARVTAHREQDAIAPLEESAQRAREIQDDVLESNALIELGWAHLRQGDTEVAGQQLDEGLQRAVAFGSKATIPRGLDGLAALAEQTGDANRAATLFGAAEGVRGTVGSAVWGIDRANRAETGSRLRARLGQKPYERLVSRGAALALDEIVEFACHPKDRPPS